MKQCPNCKNTYTDESLKFCLADGTELISLTDAEKTIAINSHDNETVAMEFEKNPVRVDFAKDDSPESVSTVISPPLQPNKLSEKV